MHVGASVGISLYPEHANAGPELLICADRALYAVKRSKKERSPFLTQTSTLSMRARACCEATLRGHCSHSQAFELSINPSSRFMMARSRPAKHFCAGSIRSEANCRPLLLSPSPNVLA